MQTGILATGRLADVAKPKPWATNLILLASDLVSLVLATFAILLISGPAPHSNAVGNLVYFTPILIAVPVLFALQRLYPAAGLSPIDEMRILVLSITGVFAVLATALALSSVTEIRLFLAVTAGWLVSVVSVSGGRVLARHLFSDQPWWGIPVLMLGAGKTAEFVINRLRTNSDLNLKVVECLDVDPNKIGTFVAGVPVTGTLASSDRLGSRRHINYAIVVLPSLEPENLKALVQDLSTVFANVVVIPNTVGMTSVGVGTRDSGGIVGLYVRGHLSLRSNLMTKRLIDILLLIPLGIVAAPLVLLSALAVVIVSPGNPFYAQEREGQGGKPFKLWKLRTMRLNGDKILEQHLATHPGARHEWNTHFKLEKDPRVIPIVGSFLRRASLDELPQVLNIAKGEMSFVGPRPFPYYHLESFEEEFRKLRSSVVPGLTGYWQVTSRSTADLVMQVELDSYYITNWSLWFDWYVLVRTPFAVILGTGAR